MPRDRVVGRPRRPPPSGRLRGAGFGVSVGAGQRQLIAMYREDDILARLETLNAIGVALSSERDLPTLLERILEAAREFADADGGTLYRVDGDKLVFEVLRNHTLGFVMGVAFPSGMRLAARIDPGGIPAHWGANAVASTLGSTLATVLAMSYGFNTALLLGAALYLLVALYTWGVIGRRYAVPQL